MSGVKYSSATEKEKRIPRPDNAFFVYKREMKDLVRTMHPSANSARCSQIIGEMWKGLSATEKAIYKQKADEKRREHFLKYPGYKFQPRRKRASSGSPHSPTDRPNSPLRQDMILNSPFKLANSLIFSPERFDAETVNDRSQEFPLADFFPPRDISLDFLTPKKTKSRSNDSLPSLLSTSFASDWSAIQQPSNWLDQSARNDQAHFYRYEETIEPDRRIEPGAPCQLPSFDTLCNSAAIQASLITGGRPPVSHF